MKQKFPAFFLVFNHNVNSEKKKKNKKKCAHGFLFTSSTAKKRDVNKILM